MRWIPISERLPEEKGEYLVVVVPIKLAKYGLKSYADLVTFNGKQWEAEEFGFSPGDDDISHWMSLPDLPEGVK